jgi:predicted aspartyl protease
MPNKTALTYRYVKLLRRIVTPVYLYGISTTTPKDTVTNALWDTGATFSAITPRIQNELNLTPIGSQLIRGVTGTKKVDVVMLTIELPNDLLKKNVKVAVCRFSDYLGLIIGMDIIILGDFMLLHGNNRTEF